MINKDNNILYYNLEDNFLNSGEDFSDTMMIKDEEKFGMQ